MLQGFGTDKTPMCTKPKLWSHRPQVTACDLCAPVLPVSGPLLVLCPVPGALCAHHLHCPGGRRTDGEAVWQIQGRDEGDWLWQRQWPRCPGWVCDGSGAHPGALYPHPPLPHLCPPTPAPPPPDISPFLPDSAQIGLPPLGSLTCLQLWHPRGFGLPLADALSDLCPHGGSWRAAKESPLARIRVHAGAELKKAS